MNLDDLKQILELVRDHSLSELEIEQDGVRLRIRRDAAGEALPRATALNQPASVPIPASTATSGESSVSISSSSKAEATAADSDAELELAVVKSPIVGTFYRSPEPTASSFVEIGSVVKKGQVLCIIEAMKLMNEIDSEYDGEVVNIYVENGQPVQYGERLFAIKTV